MAIPHFARALALIGAMAGLAACSTAVETKDPELSILYNKSAAYRGPDRNPVIVIPGILGTRLRDPISGRLVWGAFDGTAANPADPGELRQIALPIGRGDEALLKLADDVVPAGVLDRARVTFIGLPIELKIYAGILQTLGVGGYVDESLGRSGAINYGTDHYTCFQFPYDWRRDNVDAAQGLATFVDLRAKAVAAENATRFGVKDARVRFDIVAHSMGGLVARYYLMYGAQDLPEDGSLPKVTWEGARHVDKLVLVGTPNAGSVLALQNLVEGRQFAPLMPHYPAALLGTFPSLAQLLPRPRHKLVVWDADKSRPVEDLLEPALWQRLGWGLAAPDQDRVLTALIPDAKDAAERRARALALQARILRRARQFMAALDRPAPPPPAHLKIYLVAGDAERTPMTLSVDSKTGRVRVLDFGKGDGTVLRASTLLDERLNQPWAPRVRSAFRPAVTLFLPHEHVELTTNITFRDNLLHWLLEEPR
jgi:pimeloyl-ACP methyl ester carboxylesterase